MNLPYRAAYPLLGVPLEIASNAAAAITLADESYAVWHDLDPALVSPVAPARLVVIVEPRPGPPPRGAGLTIHQATPTRYEAEAGGVSMCCDRVARQAEARVPPEVLDTDPAWYRWFVNGLALLPVVQHDRHPLHAAGLVIGDTALLVFGTSGKGKSTLAYAAARAGHRLLDEDTVFVATAGGLRLWGHLDRLNLAPDTVRWFAELRDLEPAPQPHGKVRLSVPLEARGIRPALTHAGPVRLVSLARHAGPPELEPVAADDVLGPALAADEAGFDSMRHLAAPARAALQALPAYRLVSGPDPPAAVALLEALASEAANGGRERR